MDNAAKQSLCHERTIMSMRQLDEPHVIVCSRDWATRLENYLLNRDGDIDMTGAYGLPVVIDDRFDLAVLQFNENPCVKRI